MSTKEMSMNDLNKAYYERRLRMKRQWYKKNKDEVAKYNQKYYKKNIKPDDQPSSRKGSQRHSSRHSKHHSRHSRHSSRKTKSPEQIDAELNMMIKKLMLLKEQNKKRIKSRK